MENHHLEWENLRSPAPGRVTGARRVKRQVHRPKRIGGFHWAMMSNPGANRAMEMYPVKVCQLVGGLEHVFIFHFIYGMSSFPLTNSYFSRFHIFQDGYCTTSQ
jgi:hypothetical protein